MTAARKAETKTIVELTMRVELLEKALRPFAEASSKLFTDNREQLIGVNGLNAGHLFDAHHALFGEHPDKRHFEHDQHDRAAWFGWVVSHKRASPQIWYDNKPKQGKVGESLFTIKQMRLLTAEDAGLNLLQLAAKYPYQEPPSEPEPIIDLREPLLHSPAGGGRGPEPQQ